MELPAGPDPSSTAAPIHPYRHPGPGVSFPRAKPVPKCLGVIATVHFVDCLIPWLPRRKFSKVRDESISRCVYLTTASSEYHRLTDQQPRISFLSGIPV